MQCRRLLRIFDRGIDTLSDKVCPSLRSMDGMPVGYRQRDGIVIIDCYK